MQNDPRPQPNLEFEAVVAAGLTITMILAFLIAEQDAAGQEANGKEVGTYAIVVLLLAGGMFRPRALSGLDSCSSVLAVQLSSGRAHAEPDMKHRLSGHIAACCPAAPRPVPDAVESGEVPAVHAGGEGPEQSRPRRWAWPRDCVIAGGFADVSERSGGSCSGGSPTASRTSARRSRPTSTRSCRE